MAKVFCGFLFAGGF